MPVLIPFGYLSLQPSSLLSGGLLPSEAADTALNPAKCITGEDEVDMQKVPISTFIGLESIFYFGFPKYFLIDSWKTFGSLEYRPID